MSAIDEAAIAGLIRAGLERGSSPEEIAAQIVARCEDPAWAKAMSHPMRTRILRMVRLNGTCSPVRAAGAIDGVSLGTIAYHFRKLEQLGLIEVAERIPRRGAVENVFRLVE